MRRSFLGLFAAALSVSSIAALEDFPPPIYAPEEVEADTPFEAKISVRVHNWETTYAYAFRVYLAMEAGEEKNPLFYHSDCYLVHEQSLCDPTIEIADDYIGFANTSVTLSIPPTVGPSGRHYVLNVRIMKTDGSNYGARLESNVFGLNGGTAEWASYELQGYTLWGDSGIPCESYDCVKQCGFKAPELKQKNETYYDCANACPSVYIDPSSTYGGYRTAELTKPTSCAIPSTSVSATTTAGPSGTGDGLTATRSRSVVAAAGTGGASPKTVHPKLAAIPAILGVMIAYH